MDYGEYKIYFSTNFSIKYIFILCRTNNLDHIPPEKLVNGIILSEILAKSSFIMPPSHLFCYLLAVKKDSIRRRNIKITNRLLEEKSCKHDLYFLKHNKSWLNRG